MVLRYTFSTSQPCARLPLLTKPGTSCHTVTAARVYSESVKTSGASCQSVTATLLENYVQASAFSKTRLDVL
eukprot:m.253584 g.253584  ORF g.253584 m.253584 type:complete len:72 (+) comp19136_c0_seq3:110-325(+)